MALALILIAFFQAVYATGNAIEPPLLALFETWTSRLHASLAGEALLDSLVIGLLQGVADGEAIVMPYLIPFLLGLGFLEDVGYLPRLAFLMDALMHRLGLTARASSPSSWGTDARSRRSCPPASWRTAEIGSWPRLSRR